MNTPKTIIGHAPPADARWDLFLSDTRGHISAGEILGISSFGEHPKLIIQFSNPGVPPLLPHPKDVFYQQ
ncbi:MAG TPA: hypothetical protein VHG71_02135 [Verrucomicrobiae bacterium]|nr:hypothetical protein [Verrucomicrobiae bacterium]